MDFYKIEEKVDARKKEINKMTIYPNFLVTRTKDLMVRGKSFYAIWDEENDTWSTNEYDIPKIVDKDLYEYYKNRELSFDGSIHVKYMKYADTKVWEDFRRYVGSLSDNSIQLDQKLTFKDDLVNRDDHVSKRLPYSLEKKETPAYEELASTLYDPEEREKFEWAIGSIVAGESIDIQKFIVFYGEAGSGKSTILNIIQKLFEGYYAMFEAKALTNSNNQFSTEVFKSNPLVGIQHDGDLSKIEDNTKLNSIVSHEEMVINEKYKAAYTSRINCFLFMGTNQPVKITDAKSGLLRRLIEVSPSGRKVPPARYDQIMKQIDFELGGIARHCLDVYKKLGINHYNSYRPQLMIQSTDIFYNFVEENFHTFKREDGVTLKRAYEMYKVYCDDSNVQYTMPKIKFKMELANYFKKFNDDRVYVDGDRVRNYYSGFKYQKFLDPQDEPENDILIELKKQESIFDKRCGDRPAQYALDSGSPTMKWDKCKTTLNDISTYKLHYVRPEKNHIVIDFDLKDDTGQKNLELNLKAASKWPLTYSEVSKSGNGLHLHYIYDGDVERLSNLYDENIEVKVFNGKSSLRRMLSECNDISIAHISSGLPLKGEKMINYESVKSEQRLRDLISRNLKKEFHGGTKPSVDFIFKLLDDAYNSGLIYDVTDMRMKVLTFAMSSTNQAEACVKLVNKMKFKNESEYQVIEETKEYKESELIFFDVEVFPNLFIVCWESETGEPVKMINPSSKDIEELIKMRLVGFNCRRYDNHILYGRYIGYSNEELYNLSQKIIKNDKNAMFGEAYNISYTDIYDFSSKKQSLKVFEIDLGIHHQESGLPWDEPVPEEKWDEVADYCVNDVKATKATFFDRKQDFVARQILADLSGLTVNDTTQQHTAKIIFGNDKNHKNEFVYTDLSEQFPGYKFDLGKSTYKGEDPGEGGYVYSEPGMYTNVALLDVESMHPNSAIILNVFGKYTEKFKDLLDARLAIKHKDYDSAKNMLGGILENYLENEEDAKDLSYALKIVINIVYGLTSAKFQNKFTDPRNKDNIVAKRGALFMIDLKEAVQSQGFQVAHIKTDSIKIPEATPEIISFVKEFGKQYGYTFDHEATYEKLCLVNDAVYVAKEKDGDWTSTGTQFIHPVVFKELFSNEKVEFKDYCETKTVKTALYLDMNEGMGEDEHRYHFVGKVGSFCPIKPGKGGGILLREKDGKYHAATGTKGYRWLEAEMVENLDKKDDIDISYFGELVTKAYDALKKFGDPEWFCSDTADNEIPDIDIPPPWGFPCGNPEPGKEEGISFCNDCTKFVNGKCEKGIDKKKLILRKGVQK